MIANAAKNAKVIFIKWSLMKKIIFIPLIFLLVGAASPLFSNRIARQEKTMSAKGEFEINLEPQKDEDAPVGRLIIKKTYTGNITGSGIGQMISKRTENGSAAYYAIEEFIGKVNGKKGAFTLLHKGFMSKESQSLDIVILKGSGKGELKNISGSMKIIQDGGKHSYELEYKL